MSDMADMAFEQGIQEMIDGDYDEGYFDTWDRTPYTDRICKYCNKGNMHWDITPNGWRLFDETHTLHSCRTAKSNVVKRIAKQQGIPITDRKLSRRIPMGLFNRKPIYVSDRGEEFQVDEMEPSHLLNAINHHKTQINTIDWILEQTGVDADKNQMLHLRRINLHTTVEALVRELRVRDPDEDHEHLV